jgi:CHAT domain-containing protein/tetratricopeptide (TPR) repeat protein
VQGEVARLFQEVSSLFQQGSYKASIEVCTRLCAIVKQNFGESDPTYADCLIELGRLYRYMGAYSTAEPLYQKALEIMHKAYGENHPDYARSLNNIAELYRDMGAYSTAEPLYQKALEIVHKAYGENNEFYATILNNLGLMFFAKGDYSQARPLLQKALDITRNILGESHPDYAGSLNNLAQVYHDIGDYSKAEEILRKALSIRESRAKELGEVSLEYLEVLNNLGELYRDMNLYSHAERLYLDALDFIHENRNEDNLFSATIFNNLGSIFSRRGEYSKAEHFLQKTLDIRRKLLGENHPLYVQALSNMGQNYKDRGEYSKAEPILQKTLDIRRKLLGENHPHYYNSVLTIGNLYRATNQQNKAFYFLEESTKIADRMIDLVFSISSDRQRMLFLKLLESGFHSFLSLILHEFSQNSDAIEAALNLIMKRKSIVAEVLGVQREVVLGGKYPDQKLKLMELNKISTRIGEMALAGSTREESPSEFKRILAQLNIEKEQLETDLAYKIPEIRLMKNLESTNCETVANNLPEGSALLEFIRFHFSLVGEIVMNRPQYLAFILRPKEPNNVQMINLGYADVIDQLVTNFRMSIIKEGEAIQEYGRHLVTATTEPDRQHFDSWKDTGNDLYSLIFRPLLFAIGDCKRLFIAPDGDLARLPFEVLPTDKDGRRFLIDDYSISYLTTARDVLRIKKLTIEIPNEPLVAVDPDFNLTISRNSGHTRNIESMSKEIRSISKQSRDFSSNFRFDPLPGTKKEGKEISKLLNIQPWMEEKVVESSLKSYRSPRILHIATHGFFLPDELYDPNKGIPINEGENGPSHLSGQNLENPMLRSGLALAGANNRTRLEVLPPEAEDGILTAVDVSGMDLTNTELVVLSACETALGKVHAGEGVFGLRRAFVLAGAQTLVMSLWKVQDEPTKELMVDFYKRMLSGKPRAEALRESQLAMKEKYPDPYYWGAFICQGNPGPLSNQNQAANSLPT